MPLTDPGTNGLYLISALRVAPVPVWLQLCVLSLAAYHTLVLLGMLLTGRGCSTLRYRRVFQFWIVYGFSKLCTGAFRELFRILWLMTTWGSNTAHLSGSDLLVRRLVRTHSWLEALILMFLVFPLHRGLADTLAPLLFFGGTYQVEPARRANSGAETRASPLSAHTSATNSPGARSHSVGNVEGTSFRKRSWFPRASRLRHRSGYWASAASPLFEFAALVYQNLLLPSLETWEPEIDLFLGRVQAQLRQSRLAFKELLCFALAWMLARSGNAAEAAMLGNAALHGAQIGLAERLARVRRVAAAWLERDHHLEALYRGEYRDRRGHVYARHAVEGMHVTGAAAAAAADGTDAAAVRERCTHADTREMHGGDARSRQRLSSAERATRVHAGDSEANVRDGAIYRGTSKQWTPGSPAGASGRVVERFELSKEPDSDHVLGTEPEHAQSSAVVDARSRAVHVMSVAELESMKEARFPRLLAPKMEPERFPYAWCSADEAAIRQMYAADEIVRMPRSCRYGAALGPSSSVLLPSQAPRSAVGVQRSRASGWWQTLVTAFHAGVRNSTTHTNRDDDDDGDDGACAFAGQVDDGTQCPPPASKAGEAGAPALRGLSETDFGQISSEGAHPNAALHGSMLLHRPGAYKATFLNESRSCYLQSRMRTYERIRALRRQLQMQRQQRTADAIST